MKKTLCGSLQSGGCLQDAAGVGHGTIRLSVGIEDIEDLIWDLDQSFTKVRSYGNLEDTP